jgi:PilZ domain
MTVSDENKRIAPRSRALKTGTILFPNGISTFACMVRDISSTGMQISIENAQGVPDEFTLLLDDGRRRVPCNVMWRKGARFGVKIVEALIDRRHHGDWALPVPPERMAEVRAGQALRAKAAEMRAALEPKLEIRSRILKKAIAV